MKTKRILGTALLSSCLLLGSAWAEDEGGAKGAEGHGRAPAGRRPPPPREIARDALQDADANNDCISDDAEADAAVKKLGERMKENFKKRNELFLKQYDENKNGVLDGAELEKARAAKETFKETLKERVQNRRAAPGADAVPAPATP